LAGWLVGWLVGFCEHYQHMVTLETNSVIRRTCVCSFSPSSASGTTLQLLLLPLLPLLPRLPLLPLLPLLVLVLYRLLLTLFTMLPPSPPSVPPSSSEKRSSCRNDGKVRKCAALPPFAAPPFAAAVPGFVFGCIP
jgi:hypothetical protein